MNGYELTRNWFDWCFENPEKVNPNHTAIFCYAVEHCNRLGWKEKFGFPTQMAMEVLGIKKHQTYTKYFSDLVDWGFIVMIQKSTNQHTANIICLNSAMPKKDKAQDKANCKHVAGEDKAGSKQGYYNKTIKTIETNKTIKTKSIDERKSDFVEILHPFLEKYDKCLLNEFYSYWTEHGINDKKMRFEKQTSFDVGRRLGTWEKNNQKFKTENNGKQQTANGGKRQAEFTVIGATKAVIAHAERKLFQMEDSDD